MSHALAVIHDDARSLDIQRASVGLLRPIAAPADVLAAQEDTRKMVQAALQEGRDFGKIPGVDKPSLLKPGAERVSLAFGCSAQFRIVEKEVDHDRELTYLKTKWVTAAKPGNHEDLKAKGMGRNKKFGEKWVWQEKQEERGVSLGLYRYVIECQLVHRESGQVVGSCIASCSSMESKYIDRPRDSENTIIKMAEKRAMVGATLTTFGLSEQFTQDVEDLPRAAEPAEDENGARPTGAGAANGSEGTTGGAASTTTSSKGSSSGNTTAEPQPSCPTCGKDMWDNRLGKTNPKAPDYKCKDRACDGLYWPGAWPPKVEEPASPEQRAMIASLMATVPVTPKTREKIEGELANTEKPMTSERASYFIGKLNESAAKAAEKAQSAPAPVSMQSDLKELPF